MIRHLILGSGVLIFFAYALSPCAADQEKEVSLPHYEIHHTTTPPKIDGKICEPAWIAAPAFSTFYFPWKRPGLREQTLVKMLYDEEYVYLAHICQDAYITARCVQHDGPISKDDCFEIMVAPDASNVNNYFNIEWNVSGAYADGHRPKGPDGTREMWDVNGLQIAGRFVGTVNNDNDQDEYWMVEVAIPVKNFSEHAPHTPPRPGDQWRINLNRHGGETNVQYSQWSSSDTREPAFHTPHRFGYVTFSRKLSPFDLPLE